MTVTARSSVIVVVSGVVVIAACTPILGADWDRPLRASALVDPGDGGDGGDGSLASCEPPLAKCGARCCGEAMLALGNGHTCAITEVGGVKCWGANSFGQLGDDSTEDKLRPVAVLLDPAPAPPIAAIVAGHSHTCAKTSAGAVKCWGDNGSGQLGNGSIPGRLKPTDVKGLPGPVVMLSAGDNHTCAVIAATGAAYCWGQNIEGQLGSGGFASTLEAEPVPDLRSGVAALAAAADHTCALRTDGKVLCWGDNVELELGVTGTPGTERPIAGPDLGGQRATAISASGQHTCVLLEDRTVRCWGRGTEGQLGSPDYVNSATPVFALGLTSVRAVKTGTRHTCALIDDDGGAIKCWGENKKGQLGGGDKVFDPRDPAGALGVGGNHACAWLVAGDLKCWGHNAAGQLGTATRVSGPPSTAVEGL